MAVAGPMVEGTGRTKLGPGQTMAVAVAAAMAIREALTVVAAAKVSWPWTDSLSLCLHGQ